MSHKFAAIRAYPERAEVEVDTFPRWIVTASPVGTVVLKAVSPGSARQRNHFGLHRAGMGLGRPIPRPSSPLQSHTPGGAFGSPYPFACFPGPAAPPPTADVNGHGWTLPAQRRTPFVGVAVRVGVVETRGAVLGGREGCRMPAVGSG